MVYGARAWGLVAVVGVLGCNPDSSGFGGGDTAMPVDPSSSGTSTSTGAEVTTGPVASTTGIPEPVDSTETTVSVDDGTTTTTTDGTTTSSGSTTETDEPLMVQRCAFMRDLLIPDGVPEGVVLVIDIPEEGTIVELRVVIQTQHPFVGDLSYELSRSGDTVTVIDRPGAGVPHCNGDDIDVLLRDGAVETIDAVCTNDGEGLPPALFGEAQPDESLGDTFTGQPTMGTWELRAIDNITPDEGWFSGWCLQIDYE